VLPKKSIAINDAFCTIGIGIPSSLFIDPFYAEHFDINFGIKLFLFKFSTKINLTNSAFPA
jgi:hypothetical protein